MATYIQGLTDYVPQVQPFTPNLNFYSKALEFKQSKYDEGKSKLSNLYGSLLNSELSRTDNLESRKKFFETINQDIQRISGLDLSLQQNVDMAGDVFNQLLDDKYINHDMIYTKSWRAQMSKGQTLKNCVDTKDKKCEGQWWEGGDQLLAYDMKSFQEASADESLGLRPSEYVSAQNVMKMSSELAKEAGLSVQYDQIKGGYKYTYKNGEALKRPLAELFSGVIGKDPKVQAYFKAQGKLSRLNYMHSNAEAFGSKEAAEQDYINKYANTLTSQVATQMTAAEDALKSVDSKIAYLEKNKANTKRADKKQQYQNEIDQYSQQRGMYQAGVDNLQDQMNEIENARINKKFSGAQIDGMLGNQMLSNEINASAEVLANKDASVTMEADKYALADFKQKLDIHKGLILNRDKAGWDMKVKDHEYLLKYKAGEFNDNFENGGLGVSSDSNLNIKPVVGGMAINDKNDASGYDNVQNIIKESVKPFAESEKNVLDQAIKRSLVEASGDEPNKEAQEVLVDYGVAALESSLMANKALSFENIDEETAKALIEKADLNAELLKRVKGASTLNEKQSLLTKAKVLEKGFLNDLTDSQLDNLYSDFTEQFKGNFTGGTEYIQDVFNTYKNDVDLVNTTKTSISNYNKGVAKIHSSVAAAAKVDDKLSDLERAAIENYYTDGYITPKKEFTNKLLALNKGFKKSDIEELYGGEDVPEGVEDNLGFYQRVNDEEGSDLQDLYRKYYDKAADLTDAMGFANLYGTGSIAAAPLSIHFNGYEYTSFGRNIVMDVAREVISDQNDAYILSLSGDFEEDIPERDSNDQFEASEHMNILYSYMNNPKKKDELRMNVVATPIAGGRSDMLAYKITPNASWAKKNWVIKDDSNINESDQDQTFRSSVIVYMPKDKTSNVHARSMAVSPREVSYSMNGEYKFPSSDYSKDLKITPGDNGFYLSGKVFNGINPETGTVNWKSISTSYTGSQTLDQVFYNVDSYLEKITELGKSVSKNN